MSFDDGERTPRATPFLSSAPIWAALAADYALRCDTEAANIGRDMPNRARACRELAMIMRALRLDFDRWSLGTPSIEGMRQTVARWQDARAQADALRLPAGKIQ